MENLKRTIFSIIFNISEVSVIFLIGKLLKFNITTMLIIFAIFVSLRISLGGALHYKNPYRCAIWSLLIFLSMFSVANAGLITSIIMSLFCAFMLTTKGDYRDRINVE